MNLTRCGNGHFYDSDSYQHCPHCNSQSSPAQNELTHTIPKETNMTERLSGSLKAVVDQAVSQESSQAAAPAPQQQPAVNGDSLTVSFYNKSMGIEPVVGWLVCVDGAQKGKDFRLKSGRNFVGRSKQMDVSIADDNTVSRDRHAIVVYEPKNHVFLVQSGDSKELCYLNDELVLTPMPLKRNDIITVGATKLMLFPCCDGQFNWGTDGK